jgi:hypothetical protein
VKQQVGLGGARPAAFVACASFVFVVVVFAAVSVVAVAAGAFYAGLFMTGDWRDGRAAGGHQIQ